MALINEKIKYLDAWTAHNSVKLSYRDGDGKLRYETIDDYCLGSWYFYITKEDYEILGSDAISALEDGTFYGRMEDGVRFEVENKQWVRVYVNNKNLNERYSTRSDDRGKLKKLFENSGIKCFEADLKPHKRYCIDENIQVADNYRILYYDIEIDDRNPGIVVGRDKILTIAGVDDEGKEFFFHDTDEETLLQSFHDFIRWDYDILVGYNSDNFDKPYILARYKEYFMDEAIGHFKFRTIHLDLMQIFIKRFAGESDITSWSLEFISNYFLGHGKLDGGPQFGNGRGYQFYLDEFQKFKEYNIMDARNLYDLNKVLHIVDQIILECQITGCFPSRVSISELLDCFILRSVRDKGIHFASIEYSENQVRCPKCNHVCQTDEPVEEIVGDIQCSRCGEKFVPNDDDDIAGAFVFDPVPGLHDDVYVFDYKCWLPGSQIFTSVGYKSVEDVEVGDKVQVLGGVFDKIIQVHSKPHQGEILKIKLDTGLILSVTPEHRFPVRDGEGSIVDIEAKDLAIGQYLIENDPYNLSGSDEYDEIYELMGVFDCDGVYNSIPVRNTSQKYTKFQVRGYEIEFYERGKYLIDKYFPIPFEGNLVSNNDGDLPSLVYTPVLSVGNQFKNGSQQIAYDFIDQTMKNLDEDGFYLSKGKMTAYLTGCFNSDMSVNTHRKIVTINTTNKVRALRIHRVSLLLGMKCYYHQIVKKIDGIIEYRVTYRGKRTLKQIYDQILLVEKLKKDKIENLLDGFALRDDKRGIRVHDGKVRILSIERVKYDGDVYSIGVKNQKNPYYVSSGVISHNSLYPSIIRTWNIGPDTFLEPAQHEKVNDLENWHHYIKSANGQYYLSPDKKVSTIKSAVEQLLDLRKTYKNEMMTFEPGSENYKAFNAKQNAVKMLCNSMYGLMGYKYGRFYRKEIAEAITLGGQWLNKHTKAWFEKKGHNVIYGDTDSCFLKGKDLYRDDIDGLLEELHDFYDDALDEYFGVKEHFIELEYEKRFERLLLIRKKNYVGNIVELDGKVVDKFVVKGLECIKRNTIPLGKKWQRELVELLIKEDHSVSFYHQWVQDRMNIFHSEAFDLKDIIIQKKLSKHPNKYKTRNVHADIAKEMLSREMECYVGMSIPYIVTQEKPTISAVHPDWYEKGTASISYYWDQQIYSILERVLEVTYPNEDWGVYSTKISARREKKREQYARWLKDPKKNRSKMLQKLNADKVLSKVDKRKIKRSVGIRTLKAKKFDS